MRSETRKLPVTATSVGLTCWVLSCTGPTVKFPGGFLKICTEMSPSATAQSSSTSASNSTRNSQFSSTSPPAALVATVGSMGLI